MIVTLDGQRVSEPSPLSDTLQGLLDQVRTTHLRERLIVNVAVNGRRLDDAELNLALEQPVAATAQIDLESSDPVTLVRSTLRGLAEEFSAAGSRLGDLADRLTTGDANAAIREVGTFVGLWQTCYRALAQCGGLLNRDLTEVEWAGRPVKASAANLVDKLSELRGALEARDVVLLADLVRYELPPLAQAWGEMLAKLADEIENGHPGDC